MSLSYKNILKNSSILLSANVISSFLGFMTLIVIARVLGTSDFGFFILAQTYTSIYSYVVSFQTWQPTIKYGVDHLKSNELDKLCLLISNAFFLDLFIALIFGIFAIYLSLYFVNSFNWGNHYSYVIYIFPIVIFFNFSGAFNGLLRLLDEFRLIGISQVIFSSFRFFLIIFIGLKTQNIAHFTIAWVVSEILNHILILSFAFIAYRRKFGVNLNLRFPNYNGFKPFIKFLIANNIDVSTRMISRQFDVVLLGWLAGKDQVAIYKIAVQLSTIVLRLTDPLYQSLLPEMSHLIAKRKIGECRSLVNKIAGYGFLFFILSYGLLFISGEYLISFFLGGDYEASFNIMLIYFIALFGAMVGLPFVPYFHSLGRADLCMYIQVSSTFIYLLVLFPFIFFLGAKGAATSYIIYYFIWLMFTLFFFHKSKT